VRVLPARAGTRPPWCAHRVTRRTLTRALAAAGAVSGAALVARPQQVVDRLAPAFPRSKLWLARVLGARLLVQHGAVLLSPTVPVVRLASGVDLLHAVSVLPFVASPRYGRAARITGGLAAAYAALGATCTPPSRG
jgi:hypothetical protein